MMRQTSCRTLTKTEISKVISKKIGISARSASIIVDAIVEAMTQMLSTEKQIKIRDFGRFYIADRKSRLVYNPKTMASHILPARKIARFKAYPSFKKRIDAGMRYQSSVITKEKIANSKVRQQSLYVVE